MPLIIVDGHNFLFKSYAIPFEFHSPKGTPLHVVSTFLKLVRTSVAIVSTTSNENVQLAIIFDSQRENTNSMLDKEYKANRKQDFSKDENSPFIHYPFIRQVLDYLGVYNIESFNDEADDYIASLAAQAGEKTYIVSSDSDFFQLLNQDIYQLKLKKKAKYETLGKEEIESKLGVKIEDYVFYKALMGDPTDNIRGIPQIGSKRAGAIIRGELEYDLSPHKELIARNIKLITLNTTVSIDKKADFNFDSEKMRLKNKDIFDELGF